MSLSWQHSISSKWIALLAVAAAARWILRRFSLRNRVVAREQERVVILGASSGIGRCIALEYAARECRSRGAASTRIIMLVADYTQPDDLVSLRELVCKEWRGIDTLVVNAGVSALRPLLEVTGVQRSGGHFVPQEADVAGLSRLQEVALAAATGNYIGPILAAAAFVPLLSLSSKRPAIAVTSSLAAVIPAPTRSLYTSTKAASLMFFRSLAIEHPNITFSYILPATVQGDFRRSAVDGGPSREISNGVAPEVVANACIKAVDEGQRLVYVPFYWSIVPWLHGLMPRLIEMGASIKYQYHA